MKLNIVKPNVTELIKDNFKIIFSYNTPIMIHFINTGNVSITKQKYSNTTTRHIKTWLADNNVSDMNQFKVEQSEIDQIASLI